MPWQPSSPTPKSPRTERHATGHASRADHVRHPTEHPRHHPLTPRGPRREHAPEHRPPRLSVVVTAIVLFCISVPWALGCASALHIERRLAGSGGDVALHPTALDADGDGIPDAEEDALLRRYAPTALVSADEPSMPASIPWIRARNDIGHDSPRVYGTLVPRHPFSIDARQGSKDPKDWVVYGHAFPKAGGGIRVGTRMPSIPSRIVSR